MSEAFVGEIRMFAGNYAPLDWALCNGQVMPISQNTALYSILGTSYGGNGTTTFALPNLVAASPMNQGQGPGLTERQVGQQGGSATVRLTSAEMPTHTHRPQAVAVRGNRGTPTGALWAQPGAGRSTDKAYTSAAPDRALALTTLGVDGGSEPHNNLPPYLAITFIIALQGYFPSRP